MTTPFPLILPITGSRALANKRNTHSYSCSVRRLKFMWSGTMITLPVLMLIASLGYFPAGGMKTNKILCEQGRPSCQMEEICKFKCQEVFDCDLDYYEITRNKNHKNHTCVCTKIFENYTETELCSKLCLLRGAPPCIRSSRTGVVPEPSTATTSFVTTNSPMTITSMHSYTSITSMHSSMSITSTNSTMTTTFPAAPMTLPIIIAGTIVVLVVILAVVIVIVLSAGLIFRYKTKVIQERYEDSPNVERYVSKELESCSVVEGKDPMYDTIDDTTVSMQGHQTSSFNKGSQPPLPIPTDSHSRRNRPPQVISGIDNKVYFENFDATQSNGAVMPYEEPISALKSFHHSAGKEKNTSSKTETSHETEMLLQRQQQQPKCTGTENFTREVVRKHSIPASISADYAILEGPEEPETASIKAGSTGEEPVCTVPNATTADYAVLEGPTLLSDAQPYECPKHTAYGANVQKSSISLNTQNISMESPNTGPDYATLEPSNTHNK